MIEGLVSTIIPVYNRGPMLLEAVDSVLRQSWPQVEIVIVDDGSTDDTPAVIERLVREHPGRIKSLRQENAGPGVARQAGLALCTGEFIQYLDSDDLLLPEKFALQVAALRADEEAGVSYGRAWNNLDGVRQAEPSGRTGERHRKLFPAVLAGCLWETATPLFRRKVVERARPWSSKRQLEDWEFDAGIGELDVALDYRDEWLSEYRNHSGPRLCHIWQQDVKAMAERCEAYFAVHDSARRAGVPRELPEMQAFARSLFFMAREAGRYGLAVHAQRLFELARSIELRPGLEYKVFGLGARVLGWNLTSRIGERVRGMVRA